MFGLNLEEVRLALWNGNSFAALLGNVLLEVEKGVDRDYHFVDFHLFRRNLLHWGLLHLNVLFDV